MKTLSTLSIAIIATYIMSSVAGAADTGTQTGEQKSEAVPATAEQTTDLSSHAPTQTAEEKAAADAAAAEKAKAAQSAKPAPQAKQTQTQQAPRTSSSTEKSALQMRLREMMTKYNKEHKDGVQHKPADDKFFKWVKQQARAHNNKLPYDDVNFRRALAEAMNTRDREILVVAAEPQGGGDELPGEYVAGNDDVNQALAALHAKQVELDHEKERALAAEKRADESAAAYERCTTDCANAKSELEKLRANAAAAKAAAEDDARRQENADDEVRRKHRSSTDPYRDDDLDGDDSGRGGRRRSRTGGHTPSEVLGNLFGNNASPYNLYGNSPFNSPLYNPYNMNNPMTNPLLFGQNGMQNPYNNWMNQQRLAQMMMGNQYLNNPYGMMNGRQLPNMYPAPGGGGFNAYPQNPWGANPYNRGLGGPPMMAPYMNGSNSMPGAPAIAPYMGGVASSPFGGAGPGTYFNNGAYTVRPVGGGVGAPAVMPYGGAGGGYSSNFGLGGSYSYGYQYGGRPTLPNVYRLY
jgi:hypothetical protein